MAIFLTIISINFHYVRYFGLQLLYRHGKMRRRIKVSDGIKGCDINVFFEIIKY